MDSYGEKAPRQIIKFKNKVQKQSLNIGDNVEYKYIENKRRHQFSDSECGMYCLYFIIEMIKGRPFDKFLKKELKIAI